MHTQQNDGVPRTHREMMPRHLHLTLVPTPSLPTPPSMSWSLASPTKPLPVHLTHVGSQRREPCTHPKPSSDHLTHAQATEAGLYNTRPQADEAVHAPYRQAKASPSSHAYTGRRHHACTYSRLTPHMHAQEHKAETTPTAPAPIQLWPPSHAQCH
jgi:hypothetical protein